MNRKVFSFFVVTCLGAVLISGGTLTAEPAAIKLTYSTFFPSTHVQSMLAEAWCKEVEKRTQGKIYVEYYPGQTFTESTPWNCYDDVLSGRTDIGFSALAYSRTRFPLMSAVDLPLGYPDARTATKVVNDLYKRYMPKGLLDTRVMYLHANGPAFIHTKDRPVRKLEDMKGLKLRAHGSSAQLLSALHAMPVAMPMSQVYEGLQTGLLDGSIYPWEVNQGWRLGEVTRYCTTAFNIAYASSFFVIMNKDKWASIPAALQKIIVQINDEWVIKHGAAWDAGDTEGLRFFLNQGGTLIGLDQSESLRWQSAVEPVIAEYVAEAKKRGISNAQEIIDFIRQALGTYGR